MDRVDIKKFVEGGTANIDSGITKKVLIKKKKKQINLRSFLMTLLLILVVGMMLIGYFIR